MSWNERTLRNIAALGGFKLFQTKTAVKLMFIGQYSTNIGTQSHNRLKLFLVVLPNDTTEKIIKKKMENFKYKKAMRYDFPV